MHVSFLAPCYQDFFKAYYYQCKDLLDKHQPEVIYIAQKDPILFAAAFLASVEYKKVTVLVDPTWQASEWSQIIPELTPGLVFGHTDYPIESSISTNRYTPWYGYILIATGGTTGKVKFALHTWSNFVLSTQSLCSFLDIQSYNGTSSLPMYHISGLMPFVRAFISGGCFHPINFKNNLPRNNVIFKDKDYFLSVVPSILGDALQNTESIELLKLFKGIFVGGASFPEYLREKSIQMKLPVLSTYGLTETASMVALHPLNSPLPLDVNYCGVCLPHASFSLSEDRDSNFHTLCIQSTSLFYGYYPSVPRKQISLCTNDIASLVNENVLSIIGRTDTIIISGGKKILPSQVESAILSTNYVTDCIVYGQSHPKWGQSLNVMYIPSHEYTKVDSAIYVNKIKECLKSIIAPYKIPKMWTQVDVIPRNSKGKISLCKFQ